MVNKRIYIIIGIASLLAIAFYFNSGQNEESISKSLDLTTVKVLKGNLEKKEEYKYLYGIYKRFKVKFPSLTFERFTKEITSEDFNPDDFYERLGRV